MSSVLTNNGAMVALQTMKSINKGLNGVQDMISTGKRVADAKDNAAVWAISTVMESDVAGFKAVSDSLALGQSTVAVARNASEQVTELLNEMKTKIVAAQEDNVDREKIQADVSALRDQITSVVSAAQFNGLNLLQGTDDVNILSSLDRSASGTVTSSDITVQRNNLEQTASVFGTTGEAETADGNLTNNSLDVTDTLDVQKSVNLTFSDISTAPANGSSVVLTVAGQSFTVNFQNTVSGTDTAQSMYLDADTGLTLDAIATAFQTMLSTATTTGGVLEGQGITVEDTGVAQVGIHAQRATATAITIAEGAGGDTDVSVAIAGIESATADLVSGANVAATALTTTAISESIKASTSTLTLNNGAVTEGDSYRISLDGNNYDYVARSDDDLNDVANGLKTLIDAAGITGLEITVNENTTPEVSDVTLDFNFTDEDTTTDLSLTVANFADGTAGGGLEQLANINVSTESGASAALVHIENLIQSAIDASAAFGSDEKRLEIQQDFIGKLTDSMKAGIGSMVDANMEETAAKLQALQVQQQLGTQALSIANQAPQNILALFR